MNSIARCVQCQTQCAHNKQQTRATKAQKRQRNTGQREYPQHSPDIHDGMRKHPGKNASDKQTLILIAGIVHDLKKP